MRSRTNNTILTQLDKKLQALYPMLQVGRPSGGWISSVRKALNMSLRQLGARMAITPQSLRDIEKREELGTVTLKTLQDAANALDMQLVYGFVPRDGSLEKMIERKAYEMARTIVIRTSTTMHLEDQGNSSERLEQSIKELAEEIKREMPKTLWD